MYDTDICHHVCVADQWNDYVAVRKLKYLSRDTVSCCCRDIASNQLQVRLGVLLGHIHLLRPKMASAERDGRTPSRGVQTQSPLTYIHSAPPCGMLLLEHRWWNKLFSTAFCVYYSNITAHMCCASAAGHYLYLLLSATLPGVCLLLWRLLECCHLSNYSPVFKSKKAKSINFP